MWRHPDQRLSSSRENEYHHNNMLITVVIKQLLKPIVVKLFHPGGLIYFEIAAATLLMTVNLASLSGKRYWNTASLDQSPRIFIVASGILHVSSQVAIPCLRLWFEHFRDQGMLHIEISVGIAILLGLNRSRHPAGSGMKPEEHQEVLGHLSWSLE